MSLASSLRGAPLSVQHTAELRRVLALPRRAWDEDAMETLARDLTGLLRTPEGTMTLRPIQALALYEAAQFDGAFLPVRVGAGKTIVSLLMPWIMESRRPLLLVPAKLIDKTRRDQETLSQHWLIPNFVRVVSYELLGRAQAAELLDHYQPDLIVMDECHRARNPRAAVTKRLVRYLSSAKTRLVAMGGTITKRSLRDYAHLVRHALGAAKSPVPSSWTELEEWADALDEKRYEDDSRTGIGALSLLCSAEELSDGLNGARRAFRRRLVETPGVVATTEGFAGASLSVMALNVRPGAAANRALDDLRQLWALPDGTELIDGLEFWRHARELGLGFFYKWDPPGPPDWLAARKRWAACCRAILANNGRNLDSELPVVRAIDGGYYPAAEPILAAWRAIRDTFEPKTVPVWIDDFAIQACAEWGMRGPGIIWTEHQAFSERLAQMTGLAYFGRMGLDARRRAIEDADPRECVIASVASNSEGRNLQAWNRNLLTSCPANGAALEQLLARTHRDGQDADEVSAEILVTCPEHVAAWTRARRDARYIEAATGQAQKILHCDSDMPEDT